MQYGGWRDTYARRNELRVKALLDALFTCVPVDPGLPAMAERYHSCNHRACPRCGAPEQAQWTHRQEARLLPVPYYLLSGERAEPALGAGVVERNVQSAEGADGLLDECDDVILPENVSLHEQGPSAARSDLIVLPRRPETTTFAPS
jgi:Transposase zinc-binding domain